jgi:predicted ATPase
MNEPDSTLLENDFLYVVSGCSGSGKSTLISALADSGEVVVHEPGRRIVKEQIDAGGDGVPWENMQCFIDLCASKAIFDFDRHSEVDYPVFFDRSFMDVVSAVELTGLQAPASLEVALRTKRYAPIVFMSPPWEAIFESDSERRHGFAEAVAEYEVLVPTFRRFEYEIAFLPQVPVQDRLEFINSAISGRGNESA